MKIIDVSSNQGVIDWPAVAQDGVTDVIIRLSLGYADVDKAASKNSQEAAKAGIRVSYYHFAYPDRRTGTAEGDAKQEAQYFAGMAHGGAYPPPRWLAVDLEPWGNQKDTPLNRQEFLFWVKTFIQEVTALTGVVPFIYSYAPYLNAKLPADHGLGLVPLWVANYGKVATPPLPLGWDRYFMWQYSSDGAVEGISTAVDLNKLARE
ncbi:hypothetical protein DCC81_24855 [Chitinophaga parva]|uniref:Lysozyme n=1 Tax=Chitinophaga parva TaxID=2169414 RepID=A0A2T7BBR2_9BACT|nr:glycoside hydrolase family 25 protein [Chitinophaga parva]PUZ21821.1 hypothetical protein DCC81_24855 [Chitinophaga parva]